MTQFNQYHFGFEEEEIHKSKQIIPKMSSSFAVVKHVDGERLVLQQVLRTDMGGYMCIASNGVPPTISKRYEVQVNCKYMKIWKGFVSHVPYAVDGSRGSSTWEVAMKCMKQMKYHFIGERVTIHFIAAQSAFNRCELP